MNMDELRGRIDAVDDELLRCFAERMDIAGDIARYKAKHGLPVLDERREREKLFAVSEKAPEELQSYAVSLYALLFELSRSRQNRLLHRQSPLAESIQNAIGQTPPLFPEKPPATAFPFRPANIGWTARPWPTCLPCRPRRTPPAAATVPPSCWAA